LQRILNEPPDKRPPIWNVNLPALSRTEEPLGTVMAPLAQTPVDIRYRQARPADAAEETTIYEFVGEYSRRPAPSSTDVALVFEGHIVIAPLAWT
jgi:broad specificity polyphosphatase/5'/3'-nucleotidase SurE